MNKLFSLIITLALTFGIINAHAGEIPFFKGSFTSLKAQAKQAGKPFFISFYTPWCNPCQNLDKYTFVNENLSRYVDANYFAMKVDAESPANGGMQLAQEFNVMFFPTILIFSSEGKILHKFTGFKNASDFLTELKNYRFVSESPETPKPSNPVVVTTPVKSTTKPVPPPSTVIIPVSNGPDPISKGSPAKQGSGEGLFKISISPQSSAGYGVQVGVFRDYANVLKEVENLEKTFKKTVLVNINKLNNATVFKIIIGPFLNRSQATNFHTTYKSRTKRTGMIVDLSQYK